MTFEVNIKRLSQYPATIDNLEIAKVEWREVSDQIVLTADSLRQSQPGAWKNPIKPGNEELTIFLSVPQGVTNFCHFKSTHPLSRNLVKELIRLCQISVSNDQATSPIQKKYN